MEILFLFALDLSTQITTGSSLWVIYLLNDKDIVDSKRKNSRERSRIRRRIVLSLKASTLFYLQDIYDLE